MQQTPHHIAPKGMVKVECERALIAVSGEEVSGLRATKWGTPASGLIAHFFAFDFDDVGAEVSQHHGTIRSGQCLGGFDDANGIQNRLHHR